MSEPTVGLELLTSAAELACRAPSLHNSQPWRWAARGSELHLFADAGRVVRSTDRDGRQAIISCGAALHHLEVAMAAAGWRSVVKRFPDPGRPDHVAAITFTTTDHVTDAQRQRADAVLRRRTDRLPFTAPMQWDSLHAVVREAIEARGVLLDVLADELRPELTEASTLTASLRRDDDSYHHELQWWTAPYRLAEGIPGSALISNAERRRVEINRQFPARGYSERRIATVQDEAKILVLSTPSDSREAALECGEVLSSVLLECTMAGLATCALTHLTELPESRAVISALTGREAAMPQALVRVGVAPAMGTSVPPTPRRPVRDFLEFDR